MTTKPDVPPMPSSIIAQIVSLPELPMAEIKVLWRKLYGSEVPTHGRRFLEKRIAYKLQENEYRKHDPELLKRNQRRIAELIEATKPRKRNRSPQVAPGTVFNREYRGVEHVVTATPDGQYEYRGRPYASLSAIAREITGTRWSGPVFFGLQQPEPKPRTRKGGRR